MVIKLDKRNMFTGSTTPLALVKNFVTQTLMRDLLSVANLV